MCIKRVNGDYFPATCRLLFWLQSVFICLWIRLVLMFEKKFGKRKFGKEVEKVTNGTKRVTAEQYKSRLKVLHYREVKKAAAVNSKLLRDSPEINKGEDEKLSRLERTRLAQLRSGYCPLLNSYLSRTDEEIQNSCTFCNNEEHTVKHLFMSKESN